MSQSIPTLWGTASRLAGPWLAAGITNETTTRATMVRYPSPRGGLVSPSVMRWIWIHIMSSRSSGIAICRNTIRVKNRLFSVSGVRKLRAIGSPKNGSASRSSVETIATYCASVSQTSQ